MKRLISSSIISGHRKIYYNKNIKIWAAVLCSAEQIYFEILIKQFISRLFPAQFLKRVFSFFVLGSINFSSIPIACWKTRHKVYFSPPFLTKKHIPFVADLGKKSGKISADAHFSSLLLLSVTSPFWRNFILQKTIRTLLLICGSIVLRPKTTENICSTMSHNFCHVFGLQLFKCVALLKSPLFALL